MPTEQSYSYSYSNCEKQFAGKFKRLSQRNMSLPVKQESEDQQQQLKQQSDPLDFKLEQQDNSNENNNNNSGNSPKLQSEGVVAANAAESGALCGGNKASSDISSCLQSSLEQMQQRFQEMVDLILSKLDDMNGQIEELEKILLETVQRGGQQLPATD